MNSIISNSEEETLALGKKIAGYFEKGMVIVLTGDLGAGKTLFVSGMLDYFGKKEEVSSPTFTIVNEYDLDKGFKLFHFDVYRLESSDEFLAIGGDEFFEQGVCLIEWGERIADVLPEDACMIKIEKLEEDMNKRKFSFSTKGLRFDSMLNAL
ncbi:MAG: tRNA (adenosine(37)-N6)-threonylcarbamoyltransferase complex ATPase subunit type 1 TsaE [Clostridia bacterium]|nr:tRNA (adenosine(37)-N6)-threonylcarbamoyltransferase complex ATPase subunit type 1 TsaE [Clostridia bacterium]